MGLYRELRPQTGAGEVGRIRCLSLHNNVGRPWPVPDGPQGEIGVDVFVRLKY